MVFLIEIMAAGFWLLIALLIVSRIAMFAMKKWGDHSVAARFIDGFNAYTAYLRP